MSKETGHNIDLALLLTSYGGGTELFACSTEIACRPSDDERKAGYSRNVPWKTWIQKLHEDKNSVYDTVVFL